MATTRPPTVKTCPHCAKPLETAKPTSERLRKGYIEAVKRAGGIWCAGCYGYMDPTHTCYTAEEWATFRQREDEGWRQLRHRPAKRAHDRAFAHALVTVVLDAQEEAAR